MLQHHFFILSYSQLLNTLFTYYIKPNYIHKKHHIKYHTNTFSIEKTPLFLASLLIYNQYYHYANCFLIYWIIHTTIHLKPHLVPTLYTHHHLHHKYNNCNYAVSTTWPDYLFRTIKK